MLDEKRIMLMTRMASYEDNEGHDAIRICNHFRSDYISFNIIKTVVSATLAFILLAGAYVYRNFDDLLQNIYKIDIMSLAKSFLTYYIIAVGAFALISYIIYSVRYDRAKKSLKDYNSALKLLTGMYNDED